MTDSTPPPPAGVPPADRTVTALVFGIFLTMSGFIALSLYVGLNFLGARVKPPAPGPKDCRDDLADQCPEGEVCRDGVCEPDPRAVDCRDGAPCGACTCIYPMTCGDEQVCRLRPPKPRSCSPRAAEFVQEMLAYQTQCVANAGGQELSSCPTTNVKDFLLSHEKFDALLQEFPSGLVFLFPNGQPALGGELGEVRQTWPDEPTRRFYAAAIAEKAEPLLGAQHVVIVGRASKGNTATSFAYAQARVRFARNAVLDALTKTPVERGELSKKLIEFALGAERPLTLEFFLLNQLPVVSWNHDSRRELSRVLEGVRNNVPAGKNERRTVEDLINRSVAVFAIPPECVSLPGPPTPTVPPASPPPGGR